MFKRTALEELEKWHRQPSRKPLIIRGARQVGKTTLVRQFSTQFEQFIDLNLELPEDRAPFETFTTIETLLQSIFFLKNKSLQLRTKTLLFIDEIQEVPEAFNILRYIYEQAPDIVVIAAGSVLESLFNHESHFPVGRVSYLVLRPVSFPEFLSAMEETTALEALSTVPFPSYAYTKIMSLFQTYAIIGGMPEVVASYVQHRDLAILSPIFDALIASYLDDVEKYASGISQASHIRHVINTSFASAGDRIRFEGFGNSAYRSREMGEALQIAEKAFLLQLLYPVTTATLPMVPDLKRSPRLQLLDTGMLNYFVGIQKDILGTTDLEKVYQGKMIEHLTGQELLAFQFNALSRLSFWVREKKGSSAEIDFIHPFDGKLIPVEIKSGETGRLKSLHQYMEMAPHAMAVRFYGGEFKLHEASTPSGKKFHLLNLPYFLVSQVEKYLDWLQSQISL